MAWLPDGEKISKIPLFVLTQLTNVTDTHTDTHTHTHTDTHTHKHTLKCYANDTHAEIGAENRYQKTGTGFWRV